MGFSIKPHVGLRCGCGLGVWKNPPVLSQESRDELRPCGDVFREERFCYPLGTKETRIERSMTRPSLQRLRREKNRRMDPHICQERLR